VPGETAWANEEWESIWNALEVMNSLLTELWEQMSSKKKIHEYFVDLQITFLKEDKRKISFTAPTPCCASQLFTKISHGFIGKE
jgi:hypothetical protein